MLASSYGTSPLGTVENTANRECFDLQRHTLGSERRKVIPRRAVFAIVLFFLSQDRVIVLSEYRRNPRENRKGRGRDLIGRHVILFKL